MKHTKLLIVDDDEDVLQAAVMLLKPHVHTVHVLSDTDKLMNRLSREKYDVVLLDMNFTRDTSSGKEGFYWLKTILTYAPDTRVILMTAYGDVERAVKAIKEGAVHYILKPWDNDKLRAVIVSALDLHATPAPSVTTSADPEFIGKSSAMRKVFDTIRKVAPTDANVLITGENGTGKELVAKEIHRLSSRVASPYVAVDLGSLSETVFESELFGHVKGAFTDAREDRTGRFELAHGGTLFLDEIGNLTPAQQAKLLTAIQHKRVCKVGSNHVVETNVRLVAATNANLTKMIEQQLFRQDLLYRLNTVEITVPPLRERTEDIALLATYFLDLYTRKYEVSFSPQQSEHFIKKLQQHTWPGNVRELRHAVERAVILGEETNFANKEDTAESVVKLDDIEKNAIRQALKKHNGNISKAALELGLTRAALYRRMEKYAI